MQEVRHSGRTREEKKDCSGLRTGTARTLPGGLVSTLGVPSSYASLPKLVEWQIKGLL